MIKGSEEGNYKLFCQRHLSDFQPRNNRIPVEISKASLELTLVRAINSQKQRSSLLSRSLRTERSCTRRMSSC